MQIKLFVDFVDGRNDFVVKIANAGQKSSWKQHKTTWTRCPILLHCPPEKTPQVQLTTRLNIDKPGKTNASHRMRRFDFLSTSTPKISAINATNP